MALISNKAGRTDSLDDMAEKVARASEKYPPLEELTPEQARAMREERGNPFAPAMVELHEVEDIRIDRGAESTPARVYRPLPTNDPQPGLVYFHGGGFVLGDIEQYDTLCRQLAVHSGCVVISVGYTLAPEQKLPDIYREGFEAWQWLYRHAAELQLDSGRLALGGDSAGGNLGIAICSACSKAGHPQPSRLILIYPALDLTMSFPSIGEFAEGYFLTLKGMRWFRGHYLDSEDQAADPAFDFLSENLSVWPPSYVLTAGFDPIRDEGEEFARRLAGHGVPVEHECYLDMIHGFLSFAGGIPAGMEAVGKIGAVLSGK